MEASMTYSAKDKPSRGNVPEHAEMLTSAYKFGKLMMEGKIRAALRLIADDNNSGPLCLDSMVESGESVNPETVREALKKYSPGQTRKKSAIFSPSTPVTQSHPVYLTEQMHRHLAVAATASHSSVDADLKDIQRRFQAAASSPKGTFLDIRIITPSHQATATP